MRIVIDQTKCAGMGLCEAMAPTIFAVGDDGLARATSGASGADVSELEEAVLNCPTEALSIEH